MNLCYHSAADMARFRVGIGNPREKDARRKVKEAERERRRCASEIKSLYRNLFFFKRTKGSRTARPS